METLKVENLHLSPPTLRQKIEKRGYNTMTMGYLGWYLKYLTQDPQDMDQLKVALLTNDNILWTEGGLHEEFVLADLIGTKMNIAFLHILTGESQVSSQWIDSADATIERMEQLLILKQRPLIFSVKHPDHINAMKILLQGLRVLQNIQFNEDVSVENLGANNGMNPRATALFKIMEARFIYEFVNAPEKEPALVQDAIKLDQNWEWFLMGHKLARWERQDQNRHRIREIGEHHTLLKQALALNENHPMCIVANCEALAQRLKNARFPLVNGNQSFHSRGVAVAYLRNQAEKFEEHYRSPTWMFSFAKIFGDQLHQGADLDFAVRLLNRGLEAAPKSSKLNHRKAIVLAKLRKFDEADSCIRIAVESDARNKCARLDMAKLLLRKQDLSPVEAELYQLFADEYFLRWNDHNTPAAVVETLYLKAYFLMRINNFDSAIETWLRWAPLYIQRRKYLQFNFQELQGLGRWGWDSQLGPSFLEFVKTVGQRLQNFLGDHPDRRREVELLQKLLTN